MKVFILRIIPRLIIYSLIFYIFFSLRFFYAYVHPRRFISQITPAGLGLAYENITLTTRDGLKLAGWFIPQRNSHKAIVVCHGYPTDKGNVLGLASFLAPHYNLLFFDFRAMGESQGRFTTCGWNEREDFLAAVKFLKDKGFQDIGALGFSMGAAVILMSNSRDIKAIVSDCSYASLDSVLNVILQNFGIFRKSFVGIMKFWAKLFFKTDIDKNSPLQYISLEKNPIFLIHGQKDSQVPVENVLLLHQRSPKSPIWIVSGADHNGAFGLKTEEYKSRVLKFFQKNL